LKTDEIEGNQRWASQVRLSMFVCRVVVHRNNCGSHFAVNESGSVSDRAAAAHDLDALFKKSPESDRHDQGLYLCIHHRNSGRTGNIAFLAAMSRRRDSIRCGSMGRLCAAGDRDNGATAAEGFSRHDALAWDTLLSDVR
jgi:hypothetical protein